MSDDNPSPPPTAAQRLAFYDQVLERLGPELADKFVIACKHMIDSGAYGAVGVVFERGKPKRLERRETYEP